MDPVTLAATAGSALVGAMATDTWAKARDAIVGMWRRGRPDRAPSVERELEQLRRQTVDAHDQQDHLGQEALVTQWQERLAELLADAPDLADELDRVHREVLAPPPPSVKRGNVYQQVNSPCGGRNFAVQGGNLNYYEGKQPEENSSAGGPAPHTAG